MSTQFDLEQQIMDCWHVVDDLKVVSESLVEEDLDPEKAANILIGMENLYQLKFDRMFRTFNKLQREHYEALKPTMTREQLHERVIGKIDEMLEGVKENNSHGDAWVGSDEYEQYYAEHPEALPQGIEVKEEPMPDREHTLGNWGADPAAPVQLDWIEELDKKDVADYLRSSQKS